MLDAYSCHRETQVPVKLDLVLLLAVSPHGKCVTEYHAANFHNAKSCQGEGLGHVPQVLWEWRVLMNEGNIQGSGEVVT